MQLKFRGALTFDEDENLENGLQVIENKIQASENSFLTMEHIQPLGLHVTVNHSGHATEAQVNHCRDLLRQFAGLAYSGYVDMIIGESEPERFHAKEIAPKELSVDDIATT